MALQDKINKLREDILAHKVSGGRFFAGFLSACASSAFASSGMYDSGVGAAVAGGTTAVLGGGKFCNCIYKRHRTR